VSALIESHQRRLYGFMRVRARDDDLARDLVQDTWSGVLRRIDTFDSTRGSFWTFTKIWADIVLKRHWQGKTTEPVDLDTERAIDAGSEGDAIGVDLPAGLPEGLALDDRLHAARTLLDLLGRVTACSRPPHEIIVFGFSKLLWKPSEIVGDLSTHPLKSLAARLEEDYLAAVPIPAIHAAFAPLHEKLTRPLGDLIGDPRTRRGNQRLLARIAGDTTLADYYPSDRGAEAAVTQWWDAVKRAVFNDMRRGAKGSPFSWVHAERASARADRASQPGGGAA
jgi:hypothetical protein